jgi:putrescine transport system ATP-binding protein
VSNPTFISIENVVKSFGSFTAINDISLAIGQGEFFSLLGPSGCGKSTLLRMLAGFETPDRGNILLDGADVTQIPAHRRPTNMMFQSYALFPHLTVRKNIAFGLVQDRMDRAEMGKRIAEAAQKLHLEPLLDRKPAQLSGGQRQRVALARALVKRPKVLLLDEPLGALDKNLRIQTQHELVRLQKELGLTFIIVTHDQHEAMTVSSRIAIMQQGKVLQVGSPETVYEAPSSRYVAKFLGETNIYEGVAGSRDGEAIALDSDEAGGRLLGQTAEGVREGDRVWLSVRPERIELKPSGEGLSGTIEEVSYVGVERRYQVRLKSGATLEALRINRGLGDDFAVGDPVVAHWDARAARLLTQ